MSLRIICTLLKMPRVSTRKQTIRLLEATLKQVVLKTAMDSSTASLLSFLGSDEDLEAHLCTSLNGCGTSGSDLTTLLRRLKSASDGPMMTLSELIDDADECLALSTLQLGYKQMLAYLIRYYKENRYLSPRLPVARAPDRQKWLLEELDGFRFKQEVRMAKEAFHKIVEMIKDNAVFHNHSYCRQTPVDHQLLVTLRRFGYSGNGGSIGSVARYFRISEGSVEMFTNRCTSAILSLEKDVIVWPQEDEKRCISNRIQSRYTFPSCVGFIDGTLIPFSEMPELNGEDWFSRKGLYGTNCLVICDDQKKIRYLYTGWPGCSHDERVWSNSDPFCDRDQFFIGNEYLLGDSGYTSCEVLISAFKRLPNQQLSDDEKRFNELLSRIRVFVEHCIGIFKARFMSLRGLRLRIRNVDDCKRLDAWIRACAVLHNLLLSDSIPNEWYTEESQTDELDWETAAFGRRADRSRNAKTSKGVAKRERLMNIVLAQQENF
jgi:hypothetical protein